MASTLASRLEELRTAAGISASELAKLAGMARPHVRLIERGSGEGVQAKTVAQLARILGCSIDWLVTGDGERPTDEAVRVAVDCARSASPKADGGPDDPPVIAPTGTGEA